MSFRGRSSGGSGRRKENDGKYCRLTGLWPSKKNDSLWTGKLRAQDIEKVQEKLDEADKAGADVVVFLWENKEGKSRKDPEFTVQIAVSEDEGSGGRSRGGSSRRDRDENEEEEDNNEEEQDEPEEEEEKPRRGKAKKEEPRGRRSGTSKKDKNDW